MSLSGHTSPVESVAFDSGEVLVLGGASSGVIKLWDLEEAKMVRTVAGHRSNCTAVEFHPFGEFLASGSMDTNLKIWDIRKKGCIHTYKGHSQGISTIKFTPDGRWVVSGGFDNVVKVWDLTAGKLLHDFKFHEGHIRSLDFHPLEFLLATGSADRTVKFWDLETFELIGSARREATGVRSIVFHPDGRTLFTGHEDGLKVYSWEPVICHDTVDMGWTTLGDLCIHDGKLLGCSFYRNSVGVWVADISLIEPYGAGLDPKKNEGTEKNLTSGGKPVTLQRSGSLSSTKVDLPEEFKEICNLGTAKQSPATGVRVKSNEQAIRKSFIAPNIVPRDIPDSKVSAKSEKETITFSKTKPGMLLRPAHVRRASTGRFDVDRFPEDVNSGTFCDTATKLDSTKEPKVQTNLGSLNEVKESCEDKHPIKSVTDKFDKTVSPSRFSDQRKCDESSPCNEGISPVKYVNGVAVVRGRTRSLVERFERREKIQIDEDQTNVFLPTINETREKVHNEDQIEASPTPTMVFERRERIPFNEDRNNLPSVPKSISETDKSPKILSQLYRSFDTSISTVASIFFSENYVCYIICRKTCVLFCNCYFGVVQLNHVVQHFWERNDIKGATNALKKLPDQSVQADVISVLVEKMEIFTMDLFSCLLPVLTGLLDGKIERHVKVSLDMLLKLVAVFGPTIRATVSAPPSVGVDLHQEERRECCNQCFMELQKIQMILPILIRRGGLLAKSALELNLVLQQS
uniref:Katanin p80 WD40 repeat-containing subunit B1 homolog n=1 Tax=Cajanus cajan TaxID=3821 RepID=A0A151T7J3_CAJCA|nr:Katanin p80 WD40 repeat-containing subunit B1 isogeny 1 [Cajanus cajan]